MGKSILITGSTDGIGLAAARLIATKGHDVILHGRDRAKLDHAQDALRGLGGGGAVEGHLADLSRLADVEAFASAILERHTGLAALVNNAGVLMTSSTTTTDGLELSFAVNAVAPYLLTRRLLPLLGKTGRVVNVSSAAQAPVEPGALTGRVPPSDAYSQSKLALTMWSSALASELPHGPAVIALNPGSMLGTKMVQEGFGVSGREVSIGAEILARAALDEEFQAASGRYFDNDIGGFGPPPPDARDLGKCRRLVADIEAVLAAAR